MALVWTPTGNPAISNVGFASTSHTFSGVAIASGTVVVSLFQDQGGGGALRALDRQHRPEETPRAVERVRSRIAQVSVDLIFGAPGQTLTNGAPI